jgi:site-specific recombinase XerD
LAPFAAGFQSELARQGYAWSSARERLQMMAQVSSWMAEEKVTPSELTPEAVEQFLAWRRTAGYRRLSPPRALLEYLRRQGIAPTPSPPPVAVEPIDILVERYRSYLVGERGLAPLSVRGYVRVAELFLRTVSTDECLDLQRLKAAEVSGFVLEECRRRSVGSAKHLVASLRSLLRFLHVEGLTSAPLAQAAPTVAPSRGASLPRALDPKSVARLLDSCDRHGAHGKRDHAILLLLARLGLRAGEVVLLELDDIDWRRGELEVLGKADRRERLPMPPDVGTALADYLRRGRPHSESRRLFLRMHAPVTELTRDAVTGVVRAACRRSGLPPVGPHRLRHTAATEVLASGGSLEEVGQLLRHRSTFTTAIYAKVDRTALQGLARPWPGGA